MHHSIGLPYTMKCVTSSSHQGSCKIKPKNDSKTIPSYMASWQHWWGIVKSESLFGSAWNAFITLLQNFKNFVFKRIFYWPTDWLSNWCLQTSRLNLTTTQLQAWFFHCTAKCHYLCERKCRAAMRLSREFIGESMIDKL